MGCCLMNWQLSIFWLMLLIMLFWWTKIILMHYAVQWNWKLVTFHTVTQIHFILPIESTININTAKMKITPPLPKKPKHSLTGICYHPLAPFPGPYMNMHNCLNSNFANMLKQTYPTTVFIICLWLVCISN